MSFSFKNYDSCGTGQTNDIAVEGVDAAGFRPVEAAGDIRVSLSAAEQEWCDGVASERAQSYENGTTHDTTYGSGSKLGIHEQGVRAEYAISVLYALPEVDTGVFEQGDSGVDMQLVLDGEVLDVDVKSTSYGGPSQSTWTQQKEQKAGQADAYVTCFVPESGDYVVVKGWVRDEELCVEGNRTESKYGHVNYTIKDDSTLSNLPAPESERGEY